MHCLVAFGMPQTASEGQRKLQRDTRAVQNRAAPSVAAGGGIFENQF